MAASRNRSGYSYNYWRYAVFLLSFAVSEAFIISPTFSNIIRTPMRAAPRYGPPTQLPQSPPPGAASSQQKFRKFLEDAMEVCGTEFMPRLISQNMETIMSLDMQEGVDVINTFLEEAKNTSQGTYLRAKETTDLVLTFAEGVVEGMNKMQEINQETLGRIVRTMADPDKSSQAKEEELDRLMQTEKSNFTPSFLRHLEAECNRLANAPTMTPQSSQMLQIVQMIQSRVVEALGEELGEAAVILGRLTGHVENEEAIAVLESVVTVRGVAFVRELSSLCKEALYGFERVPGGADRNLVNRVSALDSRLDEYLKESDVQQ